MASAEYVIKEQICNTHTPITPITWLYYWINACCVNEMLLKTYID